MFLTVNLAQDISKYSKYLSNTLLHEIEKTLNKWEKILLYLNKRGSYNSLICWDCQYLWECSNCDSSLSVHSHSHRLICHLCGKQENIPIQCTKCSWHNLIFVGVGTQQIQEILESRFQDANIYRFDSDTMKTLRSKKAALSDLEKSHIIIGTKMLTTGFDFEKIGLIWVILVEQELSFPRYDAEENAYVNLRQFIGRGNRKSQKTTILLQTFIPKNPILQGITDESFKEFFSRTLSERKTFSYPPYKELVQLEYRDKNPEKALKFSEKLETMIRDVSPDGEYQILRSTTTFKKNNSHHTHLILKWENLRNVIKPLIPTILRNPELSVIFS